MATFVAVTASNGPRLRDADAARRVLERYFFDGDVAASILIEPREGPPTLHVHGCDWPRAWLIPKGVNREDFEPDYNLDGADGFEDFLVAISPCLAEPLTVQAIGYENCRFPIPAAEWRIVPGSTRIERNGFRHSRDAILAASEPA